METKEAAKVVKDPPEVHLPGSVIYERPRSEVPVAKIHVFPKGYVGKAVHIAANVPY